MSLQTFTLFSNIPPEIRHMIWVAAIWPRLVIVRENMGHLLSSAEQISFLNDANSSSPNHYLYSTSPVPPLLQACSESRRAMKAAGYALAFPTRDAGPRIWFNFQQDVLYFNLGTCYKYGGLGKEFYYIWKCSPPDLADLRRVKNIALQLTITEEDALSSMLALSEVLKVLNHVEDMLLVEEGCPEYDHDVWLGRDREGNLCGYVECDVSHFLERRIPCGFDHVTSRHLPNILRYKKSTNGHGRDYFQHLARTLEQKLERHRDVFYRFASCKDGLVSIRPGYLAFSIPKIRIVTINTRAGAKRLMQRREKYWEAIQNIEDEEAERGPRALSGHDAIWEDSIKAFYSLNG